MSIEAIQFPAFQPAMRIVTSITNAINAVVTTSFDHQYVTGTIVRFRIPVDFGMMQIDELTSSITVLSPTTFSVDIDTTDFDQFIVPPAPIGHLPPGAELQYAQVIPIGEINSLLAASTQNVLPYP
jgi:hypothetical protein